jgi:hypothetical protein
MLKCQYCGKEFKNQGSINLHERKCSDNPNKEVVEKKHNGCEHDWRLLNINNPTEKRAMQYGKKEVCVKCLEVK